ncbi:MAG: metallophosphoesterase [Eubacterium sp.]|nr:metallophosphoesterase [Eubacterium sp.]
MSKKILVVSDNHGNRSNLKIVLEEWGDKVDAVVHCGDSEFDPQFVKSMVDVPVYLAQGNCDFGFSEPDDIFEFEGHTCYVTHGHRYGANWGEEELVERALEMGADILIYGHTHVPVYHEYEEERVTLLNPGSVALPRQYPPEPTFLILEFHEDGNVEPHFYSIS